MVIFLLWQAFCRFLRSTSLVTLRSLEGGMRRVARFLTEGLLTALFRYGCSHTGGVLNPDQTVSLLERISLLRLLLLEHIRIHRCSREVNFALLIVLRGG